MIDQNPKQKELTELFKKIERLACRVNDRHRHSIPDEICSIQSVKFEIKNMYN